MVRSLRFWMQAMGLVEEKQEESQRVHRLSIKNFLVEPGTSTFLCMPLNVIADLLVYAFENIYYFVVTQLLPKLGSNLQDSLFRKIGNEIFDEKALKRIR